MGDFDMSATLCQGSCIQPEVHLDSYNRGIQDGIQMARAESKQGVPGPKNLQNRKKRELRKLKRKETMLKMKEARGGNGLA